MNVPLIFVLTGVAIVSGLSFFAVMRQRAGQLTGNQDFEARWQQVDMAAFMNLSDPMEERFLQQNLPAAEFRRIQRQRVIVMWEYLSRLSVNTKLMVQAGQIVQHTTMGDAAVAARQFVSSAMQTRMAIFMAEASLVLKFVFPATADPIHELVRRYDLLSQRFAQTWTEHKLAGAISAAS
jgi:hypothetical protein